jgi:hypothetical protein
MAWGSSWAGGSDGLGQQLGWRQRRPGAATSRGGARSVSLTKKRRERLDPFCSGTERFSHGDKKKTAG